MADDAIPGLHRRVCKSCDSQVALSIADSTVVSTGALIETRSARCPSCHEIIIYHVPSGKDGPTSHDATVRGLIKSRISRVFTSRR